MWPAGWHDSLSAALRDRGVSVLPPSHCNPSESAESAAAADFSLSMAGGRLVCMRCKEEGYDTPVLADPGPPLLSPDRV